MKNTLIIWNLNNQNRKIQVLKAKSQINNKHKNQKNKFKKNKAAAVAMKNPIAKIKIKKIGKKNNLHHLLRHHENFQIT